MEYIKTATGKQYNVTHCGSMNDYLFISFIGYSFLDLAGVMSDSEETNIIEYYATTDISSKTYRGYTVLTDMTLEDEGVIRITLKQPE